MVGVTLCVIDHNGSDAYFVSNGGAHGFELVNSCIILEISNSEKEKLDGSLIYFSSEDIKNLIKKKEDILRDVRT